MPSGSHALEPLLWPLSPDGPGWRAPGKRRGPWLCGDWGNEACNRKEETVRFLKLRQTRSGKPPRRQVTRFGRFPSIRAHRSGVIPCHFHHQASQCEHRQSALWARLPTQSCALKAVGCWAERVEGPVRRPCPVVCLWAGSHAPGPWASGPGSCSVSVSAAGTVCLASLEWSFVSRRGEVIPWLA